MCKRSKTPYPMGELDLAGYLKKAWMNGWLDEYSDEHFMIKAIESRITNIEWENQLIFNNSNTIYSPITSNGKIDFSVFASNFVINLSSRLNVMSQKFGEKSIKRFVQNQLSAGKSHYNRDIFFKHYRKLRYYLFIVADMHGKT